MKLRADRLVIRRRELGLSQRELAYRLGINQNVLVSMESDMANDLRTLREVQALSEELSADPMWLLGLTPADSSCEPHHDLEQEVARVGAIIARIGEPVPRTALAQATKLTLSELGAVLTTLDGRLRECGMQLSHNRIGDSVRVVVAANQDLDAQQTKRIVRAALARAQLDKPSAEIVYRTIRGTLTAKRARRSMRTNAQLERLIAAGVISEPARDSDKLKLTRAAARSLLLEPPAGT